MPNVALAAERICPRLEGAACLPVTGAWEVKSDE